MLKRTSTLRILILFCLLGSAIPVPAIAWSEQVFAPYVDTGLYPEFSITGMHAETGVPCYTLAFITSDSSGNPAWGGVIPLHERHFGQQVDALRSGGGDIVISFGGANGRELAQADQDVPRLTEKYQAVIDAYESTWVDFDIEGAAVAEHDSVRCRNMALQRLQAANPDLHVSYTLPVLPSGLTPDGLALLEDAISAGVSVDRVNLMVMDYGDWAAPDPSGNMGMYAITAAESVFSQLKHLYPQKSDQEVWAMIGLTPMIGQNDVSSEVFLPEDASKVEEFARARGIGFLSMWSANRDNGDCGRTVWASCSCSGIIQEEFAFSRIFNRFTSGTSPDPGPTPRPDPTPVGTPIPTLSPTQVVTQVPTTPVPGLTREWNPSTVYTAGDTVTCDGQEYSAKWWTTGEVPGIANVWKCISCSGSEPPSEWNPGKVYESGDQVVYQGSSYQAQWWTEGDVPGSAPVWKTVLSPPPVTPPVPDPTPVVTPLPTATPAIPSPPAVHEWNPEAVYSAGDQVMYGNNAYSARWWTSGDVPGIAYVWKALFTGDPSVWNPVKIYTAQDRSLYEGQIFEAQWWTQGDVPGTAPVWKRVPS